MVQELRLEPDASGQLGAGAALTWLRPRLLLASLPWLPPRHSALRRHAVRLDYEAGLD